MPWPGLDNQGAGARDASRIQSATGEEPAALHVEEREPERQWSTDRPGERRPHAVSLVAKCAWRRERGQARQNAEVDIFRAAEAAVSGRDHESRAPELHEWAEGAGHGLRERGGRTLRQK